MSINNDGGSTLSLSPIVKGAGGRVGPQQTCHLRQIVAQDGTPYKAFGTSNLWVGDDQAFMPPREGNKVVPFTTGEAYFTTVAAAFKAAASEIWIAGWEVNWDVTLVPAKDGQPAERLIDVLLIAATQGVKIYVMPWSGSSAVPTYAKETEEALLQINKKLGKRLVFVKLSSPMADSKNLFFSHHQKHVVIDRQIAFVGGIDLTYGRLDDASYNLVANARGQEALERYNGCVIPMDKADPSRTIDPLKLRPQATPPRDEGGSNAAEVFAEERRVAQLQAKLWDRSTHQYPTSSAGETLDPSIQPRMPWQDSQVQIEGPAAADVALNFAMRWNCSSSADRLKLPDPASGYPAKGPCIVQVLRSAPAEMCKKEYNAIPGTEREKYFPKGLRGNAQDNVYESMLNLIGRAQHFIYIENQFFVSDYGRDAGYRAGSISAPRQEVVDGQSLLDKQKARASNAIYFWKDAETHPQNQIAAALAQRIGIAILSADHLPFHVFITLPVHPEGRLDDPVVMTQVHQTMQTLVFGELSLINRVRRFLKLKQLKDQGVKDWMNQCDADYSDIPVEACEPWLTLLNLRNWACLGSEKAPFHVTEQIYVHNKMIIVDDMYAIVGSANINERSMSGHRDSELSVLVTDTDTSLVDLRQDGKPRPARNFARQLRQEVWKKIFGITAGGDRAANSLQDAIEHPASPDMWEEIRRVAACNTALYEAGFPHIPRSVAYSEVLSRRRTVASLWPVPESEMPFSESFWTARVERPASEGLRKIKGFITLLPLAWTVGENNHFDYDAALYSLQDHTNTDRKMTQLASTALQSGEIS